MTNFGFEVFMRIHLKFCWGEMQKILKYTFSLNHKVEISNLPERVLDLTQKLSEWVPLQRFLHRQLGVWLYLKPGVVTEVWLSDQIRSAAQSCLTLCNPMNHSTPGLPVHHQLLEFTQTHVHWVSDAIQLSHPLSSPSPLAPNPSQHQSLFQLVNSSHEVDKVLEFQL